jgi:hypothetical protein
MKKNAWKTGKGGKFGPSLDTKSPKPAYNPRAHPSSPPFFYACKQWKRKTWKTKVREVFFSPPFISLVKQQQRWRWTTVLDQPPSYSLLPNLFYPSQVSYSHLFNDYDLKILNLFVIYQWRKISSGLFGCSETEGE